MEAISLLNYTFAYPQAPQAALRGIDLCIKEGEFVAVCGLSGCGKTTLLRTLKPELRPVGAAQGAIKLFETPAEALLPEDSAKKIGFVQQRPENQIVTDTVWSELAFGLENLGVEAEIIRRRVAEIAHFFGIGPWFSAKTSELSGGQKQLLNLASVLAMQPQLILLDEPTALLDPIAAKDFLQALVRVHDELGITIVLAEHHLEDVLPIATRVIWMEEGTIKADAAPSQFALTVCQENPAFAQALPAAAQVAYALGERKQLPISVAQGRAWLQSHHLSCHIAPLPSPAVQHEKPLLEAKDLWVRYARNAPFVLKGACFSLCPGEIHTIVGGNGSGKSTLFSALSGVLSPSRGKVWRAKGTCLAQLLQDPMALFSCETVLQELMELQDDGQDCLAEVEEMMALFGLSELSDRHPYDLSGGEMQMLAVCKLLLLHPHILLLDEPTKGMDVLRQSRLCEILQQLAAQGRAIGIITHDLAFAARVSTRCSMMFMGNLAATDEGRAFFLGNAAYTTGTHRVTRGILPQCVLPEDVCHG